MCAFLHVAGAVFDDDVVGFVVFNIELENQIQALCRVGVKALFHLVKNLSYRHCYTLLGVRPNIVGTESLRGLCQRWLSAKPVRLYGEADILSSSIERLFELL